jgi:hypothetical protein
MARSGWITPQEFAMNWGNPAVPKFTSWFVARCMPGRWAACVEVLKLPAGLGTNPACQHGAGAGDPTAGPLLSRTNASAFAKPVAISSSPEGFELDEGQGGHPSRLPRAGNGQRLTLQGWKDHGSTWYMAIIPISMCSSMWQWNIQLPTRSGTMSAVTNCAGKIEKMSVWCLSRVTTFPCQWGV